MSNAATTQQILQAVERTKTRANTAEQEFDRANALIQRRASQSIDLFGGSASSTVANLARDARRACDDLYSAYQSLIITLDEICRPLLSEDPDMVAVKDVAVLMKKLNDDSEIEANFTASFNGSNLGDVAGSRYVPSMNCKMLQRYWEDRYASWPGRAEMEAQARQREEELKRQAEEQANKEYNERMRKYEQQLQQYEQEMQEYHKAFAQWETESQKIQATREEELQRRQAAFEQKQLEQFREAYNKRKQKVAKNRVSVEQDLERARTELAQAGFFDFGTKKNAKITIQTKTVELNTLQATMDGLEKEYQEKKINIASVLEKRRESVRTALKREYPLPQEPKQPIKPTEPVKPRPAPTPNFSATYTASNLGNESLKQAILDSMLYGEKYTVADIMMICPEVAGMTNQRVSALVRQLWASDDLIRTEEGRRVYFELG